ncbi:MAG TPA: XTP/dITP diphosphatase [Chloroflexi bacterium]|nr:XTP/dITP diphosphatase [Chloroflexota bacterium]
MSTGHRKLLVATRNQGKVREYRRLLASLPVEITYLDQEGIDHQIVETGSTFTDNAVQKARGYASLSGLLTLADDSGLEVDALAGEPGVHSARYAGEKATDEERYQLLLERLKGVRWEDRTARFRCVMAVAEPGGDIHTAEGVCEGLIALAPAGDFGFGYDPVFYLPEHDKTMAQLDPEVKNRISHRARAARKIRPVLARLLRRDHVSGSG